MLGCTRAVALTLCALALAPAPVGAQAGAPMSPLVGTWTLVLVDNVQPDGQRVHLYGDDPHGILTFDAQGRYALQILSGGRPRFASNDKAKGTPEEYKAAVQGSNSHFGRYSAADGALTFQIEHASYPNWEGTQQKRPFTITGDQLKYTVPNPTTGGGATGEVVWKRAP